MPGAFPDAPALHAGSDLDRLRRAAGDLLELGGWGPVSRPFEAVSARPGAVLRRYGRDGSPVLIVPAPIKRPYIWDLSPEVSVVGRLLAAGFDVHLLAWTERREAGLADYAWRLIDAAVDDVAAATGRDAVILAGHSLGGTLAAVFASLRPERVRALLLVETPLRFGPAAGAFAPLVAAAPDAAVVARAAGDAVPGVLLDAFAIAAAPASFVVFPALDRLTSLADPAALATHLRVMRWALDEFPMPAGLFEDIVEHLYRRDRFWRGELQIDERTAALDALAETRLLIVVDPESRIVPPASAAPECRALRGSNSRVFARPAETGVGLQHLGALVGRKAHERLWPELVDLLRRLH